MHTLAVGFWGAFFGTATLMMAAAIAAYIQSRQRVALTAALSALVSALFVVAYLGWFPIADAAVEARLVGHVAVIAATVLGLMLLTMLGYLRKPTTARRTRIRMTSLAAAALAVGWLLDAMQALAFSSVVALGIGGAGLGVGIRSARRGDRQAWVAVSGITFMLVSLAGLSWIAMNRNGVAWQVHLASALAGMAYLSAMATAMWQRYSYLIELREVLAHGPRYDPVTRMRSNAETGNMVGMAFFSEPQGETRPVGVVAISIGNFYALENLHGRAAVNHALFVCAGRLRRCVPADVEMGRLSEDGFLLVARNAIDLPRMVQLSRVVAERLSKPVKLSTEAVAGRMEGKALWAAQVGVGLIVTSARERPSAVLAIARDMSRTAWTYASRVAWHDQSTGQIAELPAAEMV